VPAPVQQYGASGFDRGKQERQGSPETKEYEQGGRRQGHNFSNTDRTDRATQEGVQFQRAGPQGNSFTDSPKQATVCSQ